MVHKVETYCAGFVQFCHGSILPICNCSLIMTLMWLQLHHSYGTIQIHSLHSEGVLVDTCLSGPGSHMPN